MELASVNLVKFALIGCFLTPKLRWPNILILFTKLVVALLKKVHNKII